MTAQLITAVIGMWLMAAPAVLDYGGVAATTNRIVGPTVAAIAIIAAAQVMRAVRWVNMPLGVWLVAAPVFSSYGGMARASSIGTGAVIILLCFVRGRITHQYAGGWSSLWERPQAR